MSEVTTLKNGINLYNKDAFYKLQEAGNILKGIRDELVENATEGNTTNALNELAESLIIKNNCDTLFKGFGNYPYTTCLSNNEQIVHGIPTDDPLKIGDVLTIDIGLKYKGYCADSARTVIIGDNPPEDDILLLETAKKGFEAGLEKAYPGNTTGDIGFAIHKQVIFPQKIPEDWRSGYKFKIFVQFSGHGIGLELHEPPTIPNFGSLGKGLELLEGMCFCIEPVVLYAESEVCMQEIDGITRFTTHDLKPSAQYENQVYLSSNGPIVLT